MGTITIAKPGPEIDFPGATPAGTLIAPRIQRNAAGLGQFWRLGHADLPPGIQGKQV
ncbi:hypothetical protein CA13_74110 [Planctomycetes bacterium CA13]|uniref:Uncharacterized protein n=1 Tax=Novipirellula herctigrandis TaxID=2527986 RepID=A0A5C5YIK5_9BACT|nr:hypothetical protein CA13_74110 [Planctomycetes bacterium CA13]